MQIAQQSRCRLDIGGHCHAERFSHPQRQHRRLMFFRVDVRRRF